MTKKITDLKDSDLAKHKVWEYCDDPTSDEILVRPAKQIPVDHLRGRVVAARVTLANGTQRWAVIGNVNPKNALVTHHFITLSTPLGDGSWFTLARYFDLDYTTRGPAKLAQMLDLPLSDVFPIEYDLRDAVNGDANALTGKIEEHPEKPLSEDEIMALAVKLGT